FGVAAWRLGAGRARAEDAVVHAAGIDLLVKPGDRVTAGQPVFTLSADDPSRFPRAIQALEGAWNVDAAAAEVPEARRAARLVRERITA
ncbi:MAG TPA: thymidine phosphorylase, partial [Microbacterium sp.]|nr:thymidine phosphorylase [Microbacterium sp.]